MLINVPTEIKNLSIASMCLYAARNRLLYNPSQFDSVQMAWEQLVFVVSHASHHKVNEIDLYQEVTDLKLEEVSDVSR